MNAVKFSLRNTRFKLFMDYSDRNVQNRSEAQESEKLKLQLWKSSPCDGR